MRLVIFSTMLIVAGTILVFGHNLENSVFQSPQSFVGSLFDPGEAHTHRGR